MGQNAASFCSHAGEGEIRLPFPTGEGRGRGMGVKNQSPRISCQLAPVHPAGRLVRQEPGDAPHARAGHGAGQRASHRHTGQWRGHRIRRPGGQGLLDITWTSDRVRAVLTINGRGDVTDLEPNFASSLYTNPGYVTTMAGASFVIGSGVEVFGRVTNLFNQSYEEVFGYPALGRAAMIGVRVARSR